MNPIRHCITAALALGAAVLGAAEPIKVLIIDGRNNHDWQGTTASLKATLAAVGGFQVDVSTAPPAFTKRAPQRPKKMDDKQKAAFDKAFQAWKDEESAFNRAHAGEWEKWLPEFGKYQVLVNNYNGAEWTDPVKQAFTAYVLQGGGLVNVHAANNAFTNWDEFNEMICFGWRGETFKDRVAVDDATGKAVAVPREKEKFQDRGFGSGHGPKHAFVLKGRNMDHPIQKGMPVEWLHASDELYHRMRGDAGHVDVLASAYSSPEDHAKGTGMHEPMVWWAKFGQGRVVTTSMGHLMGGVPLDPLHCVGFQTVFARSVEWAATNKVTLEVPKEFPTKDKESVVEPSKVSWKRSN